MSTRCSHKENTVLKRIRKEFVRSVGIGTINGLLDELLEKRVLNQEEVQIVRCERSVVMDKARTLVDGLTGKGPQACQICIDYICEEDCHLARTLGLFSGPHTGNNFSTQDSQRVVPSSSASQEVQDNQAVNQALNQAVFISSGPVGSLKLCPLEKAQTIWKEKSAEIYPLMSKLTRTRLALIICNTEFDSLPRRAGAEMDIRNMRALLEGLGYQVIVRENLTASEMAMEVKAFAACPQHKTSDSTFLVLMSHGVPDGICGKKYSAEVSDVLKVSTIFLMLNTSNCASLKDKPKVIVIQACRGENPGVVWLKDSAGSSENKILLSPEVFVNDGIKKAHIEKDFIAFCSSTPDNVSWRHPERGSLFIVELVKTMQEYAWCCDLQEVFRKVQLAFEIPDPVAQMPTTERVTLTKLFYLFPGH
ncbi:PREDICTED: caspase-1-like isoform X1 [Chinchilla lanigera]|uniref:caspase-1-like isoform X1 n=1 Tax=Chinchilla lanigera TaxID=34839 RepID=UPI0006965E04|nr:PREDICTED: caspase-1-like isoform X1 [Chinchilla lanigera]